MRILGIGVDLVEVPRIQRALARWGGRFVARIFTESERLRAGGGPNRVLRLAARFAAKEAVMKALGTGRKGVGWREVEITNDPTGRPRVRLWGRAARVARRRGIREVHVSLTHGHEYAAAFAVAEGEEPGEEER
ncbi:MAG: holo-ACP synthase [Armatimonadetes bacterium]|nr:holo-ACP synthase [Armatimonadota bacterium]MDW8153329.1 holo-ACP synthase [Armatimonadota bacterium]